MYYPYAIKKLQCAHMEAKLLLGQALVLIGSNALKGIYNLEIGAKDFPYRGFRQFGLDIANLA